MNKDSSHLQVQKSNFQIYGHQVSGKTPKFTDKSEKYIYKAYSECQGNFFQYLSKCHIGHNSYLLGKYIPPYFGVFTQSQILHLQDNRESSHQHSNLPNQILESIGEIAKQELSHMDTTSQRKQWIQHINARSTYEKNQRFIKIKNLTYGYRYPNIMDIKLGIKNKKKKISQKLKKATTITHGFRINGLSVRQFYQRQNENGVQSFMSKYYCQKISQEHLNKHLAFFMFDGNKVHLELLDNLIQHLKQIILGFMSFTGIKFGSSSLYFAYDAYDPKKYTINFIDFDKYEEGLGIDESVEKGLKNCLRHFIQIRKSILTIQDRLINKEISYLQDDHDVIPKAKIQQYEKRSKGLPQHKEQEQIQNDSKIKM